MGLRERSRAHRARILMSCSHTTLLYDANMGRKWSHRQAAVREALDEAVVAGLRVKDTPGHHGHRWGYIDCADLDCVDPMTRFYVNSTPTSAGNEANRIRRFVRRHQHKSR